MKVMTASHASKPALTKKQINAGYMIADITIKSYSPGFYFLTPTWDLVNGFKSGSISEEEYKKLYFKLINEKTSDYKIKKLSKKNLILVCYCTSGFCHRYLAAEFLVEKGAKYYGEYNR